MTVLLAHGSLGAFDEIIFLGIAAVFLIAMGISWFRSRYNQPPTRDSAELSSSVSEFEPESTDHFPLS